MPIGASFVRIRAMISTWDVLSCERPFSRNCPAWPNLKVLDLYTLPHEAHRQRENVPVCVSAHVGFWLPGKGRSGGRVPESDGAPWRMADFRDKALYAKRSASLTGSHQGYGPYQREQSIPGGGHRPRVDLFPQNRSPLAEGVWLSRNPPGIGTNVLLDCFMNDPMQKKIR